MKAGNFVVVLAVNLVITIVLSCVIWFVMNLVVEVSMRDVFMCSSLIVLFILYPLLFSYAGSGKMLDK